MFKAKQMTTAGATFAFFAALTPLQADAASSSVSLSIHFEVAPSELFRAPNIEPATIRTCESLKTRIDTSWRDKPRGPVLKCSSPATMPLVVTHESDRTLIVRP